LRPTSASRRPHHLALLFNAYGADVWLRAAANAAVYQEVLADECLSIAVLPPADLTGVPELLVSGKHTVWRYRHK